jgi:hypothetical protein
VNGRALTKRLAEARTEIDEGPGEYEKPPITVVNRDERLTMRALALAHLLHEARDMARYAQQNSYATFGKSRKWEVIRNRKTSDRTAKYSYSFRLKLRDKGRRKDFVDRVKPFPRTKDAR